MLSLGQLNEPQSHGRTAQSPQRSVQTGGLDTDSVPSERLCEFAFDHLAPFVEIGWEDRENKGGIGDAQPFLETFGDLSELG